VKVLFDTNVLLDVLAERQPFYGESARVWTLADTGKMTGLVSAIAYPTVYYIVQKVNGRRRAVPVLRTLRGIFRTVPCDEQILDEALGAGFPDFEDAIQVFSAIRAEADCILTRNGRDFARATIPALSPAEFLAQYSR
jgi:predicted nucleic acid-binding protein